MVKSVYNVGSRGYVTMLVSTRFCRCTVRVCTHIHIYIYLSLYIYVCVYEPVNKEDNRTHEQASKQAYARRCSSLRRYIETQNLCTSIFTCICMRKYPGQKIEEIPHPSIPPSVRPSIHPSIQPSKGTYAHMLFHKAASCISS